MARTNASLWAKIEELERKLQNALGVPSRVSDEPEDRPDHIPHGSPEHVQFLGLKVVDEADDTTGFVLFTSKVSDITYRLEDEFGALVAYPGVDPDKAALLLLRQKVNVIEAGKPPITDKAPSMWQPLDQYVTLTAGG